ncbi:MAG TPA: DUF1592 domain-containing protein [Pirellulales bacterium]|nr:DUF1592 domain-containing protein [Pirellulales bacterium]
MRVFPLAFTTFSLALLAWAPFAAAESGQRPDPALAEAFAGQVQPFLKKYCTQCHSGEKPKADLNLDQYADLAAAAKDRKVWENVLENVRDGIMPPDPETKPGQAERDAVTGWIGKQFTEIDCGLAKDPGRVTIRRLNRNEYNNTIRDLCLVDFRPADDFPADDVGYGFDHIGDVLSMPPILLEKYLNAAEQIVEKAIYVHGPEKTPLHRFDAADAGHEGGIAHGHGWAFPSTGAVFVEFDFPAPGLYALRGKAFGQQAGPDPARMAFRLDDKQIHVADVTAVDGDPMMYETQVRIGPGKQRFALAFINDYYNPDAPDPKQRDRNLFIDALEIQGPLDGPPPAPPESHKHIIFVQPEKDNHRECAEKIIKVFASRAYRRRATKDEIARLVKFVEDAEKRGESFERGIQVAMEAVLVSPYFLFRVELDREPNNPKAIHPIDEFELATRLSYFLWSSMPDDELFRLAAQGELRHADTLEQQVRRMLKDPKARALVDNFAGQWLEIRRLKTMTPDAKRFPAFDEELREAMLKETELFFASVMEEDRSVLDFIDADYTFLNERLAKHYGIDGVSGPEFRRVKLDNPDRGGLVTQASVLTVTSNPTRTSPVKRGKWILEELFNSPPPPPPPDAPDLKEDEKVALSGSLRQRMEQHRANPSCAACHARMDPLGFGLENFDAIGAWRDRDGEFAIDASGELPDGSKFKRPAELKAILKAKQDDFARCLTEKMLTYALGRGLEYYDKCAIDEIASKLAKSGYKFSTLILEIVASDPFQLRRGKGTE